MAKMSFEDLAKATGRKMDTVVAEYCQDVAFEVIKKTPVDTGFARGSWFATLDGSKAGPKSGAATIGSILSQAKAGQLIFIGNNAEYIGALENGHSRQAPQGMVSTTIRDSDRIMRETANRIKKK